MKQVATFTELLNLHALAISESLLDAEMLKNFIYLNSIKTSFENGHALQYEIKYLKKNKNKILVKLLLLRILVIFIMLSNFLVLNCCLFRNLEIK